MSSDRAMAILGLLLGVPIAVFAVVVGAPLIAAPAIVLGFVVVALVTP